MRLQFEVDESCLAIGKKRDDSCCAVAVALKWSDPLSVRTVKVTSDTIRFSDVISRVRYVYQTPENVRVFIDRWDNDLPVEPFTVVLKANDIITTKDMHIRRPSELVRREAPIKKGEPGPPKYVRPIRKI